MLRLFYRQIPAESLVRDDKHFMDTLSEERLEVWGSVLDGMAAGPDPDGEAACLGLLRHLIASGYRLTGTTSSKILAGN